MKKQGLVFVIMTMLFVFPTKSFAILDYDVASLESMISNHKKVKTVLGIRAAAEMGVMEAHKAFSKSSNSYEESSKAIDRYKRCFDIIDLLLNGTATAFHGVNTYRSVKSNVELYLKLLDDYKTNFLLKGNVKNDDAVIYTTSVETIKQIKSSAISMYDSYIDLAAYLTGAAEFDAQSMMICLQCINDNMDDIDSAVKNAYFTLYSYMVMRKGFWKDGLYRGKTIKDLAMEAYDTWKEAQKKAKKKNSRAGGDSESEKRVPLGGGSLLGNKRLSEEEI